MTSRAVVVQLGLCVLSAACIKVPEFQGRGDGGPEDRDAQGDGGISLPTVKVVPNGAGATVTGPGYTIEFSETGAHFPTQLIAGGEQLIGGSQQCADEEGMGVAIYPVTRINGNTTGLTSATLTTPLRGDVVGQVRLQWTSNACGTGNLTGYSAFSFFPDGRITRFDVIDSPVSRTLGNCSLCGGTGTEFVVTSYTTLALDSGAYLSDGTESDLTTYGDGVNPGNAACLNERGQSIAFVFGNGISSRLRLVDTAPTRALAFVRDLHRDTTLPAQGEFVTTTHMGISASEDCTALDQRVNDASGDHQLVLNGVPMGAALADGIYGGNFTGDPDRQGVPADFPVTLTPYDTTTARIPAGFAVWLYSNPMPANLTLTHSGGHTGNNWYREQRVGQDRIVFWFNVSLESGQTITISES